MSPFAVRSLSMDSYRVSPSEPTRFLRLMLMTFATVVKAAPQTIIIMASREVLRSIRLAKQPKVISIRILRYWYQITSHLGSAVLTLIITATTQISVIITICIMALKATDPTAISTNSSASFLPADFHPCLTGFIDPKKRLSQIFIVLLLPGSVGGQTNGTVGPWD